jgi:hypothetical protein
MATKLIGGTDGMHVKPDRSPFKEPGGKATSKFASSEAAHAHASGRKGPIIEGIQRRKKPLNGSGAV